MLQKGLWMSPEKIAHNSPLTREVFRIDNRVEETLGFDRGRQFSVIDECKSHGLPTRYAKPFPLLFHFRNNLTSNLPLSLDFDEIHESLCLQQQVNLESLAPPPDLAIGTRGSNQRSGKIQLFLT